MWPLYPNGYPSCTHTRIRGGFTKVHTDSHAFATDSRMDSRAFTTHSRADSSRFTKIPQDSPGFSKDLRRFADLPKFTRILRDIRRFAKVRNGYTPIRGWIYADLQSSRMDIADGYSSRMDVQRRGASEELRGRCMSCGEKSKSAHQNRIASKSGPSLHLTCNSLVGLRGPASGLFQELRNHAHT